MKRDGYISWDEYFMGVASLSAQRSKDPSTQVGACIVNDENRIMTVGYNGFPLGCSDDEFPWDRTGDELDTRIKKALEGFFIDHDGSSVQFDFNDSDDEPTLEASVKIDEETIKMNEYGQLYVDLSELNIEGGSGSGSELDIDDLKEKILAEINVPEVPELSEGSGIKIDKVDGLNILGVAVDGYTIKVDQDTNEIYVDTQILADILGSGDGSGNGSTSCGSHTHTVDQIQDFRKEVIEIIKKNVTFEIDDLSSLIDGTTIKIDSNGKLYSVAGSSVKAHRHLLKDIDDWDPSWTIKAVFQSLAPYIEDRSLDLHYLKFESMDLGFALYTIDNELYKTELQIKNLEKALVVLRTRLYEREYNKYMEEMSSKRKTMVATGDRSEKVRTYNYPQSRVTDHRIGYTMYNLAAFMDGDIEDLIDALQLAENAEKLKASVG